MDLQSGFGRIAIRCIVDMALALLVPGLAQATTAVPAGKARFEFLTPSLVRME